MFMAFMIIAQVACFAAGLALGGFATPEGGALLLAAMGSSGAGVGWFVRKVIGGGHDDLQQ